MIAEWVKQSKNHWIPGSEVTVDESIYAYAFICWLIFRNPFPSGVEALEQFMNRWNYPTKVHFVADAAFGTWLWPLLKRCTAEGSWKACQNELYMCSILNRFDERDNSKRYHKIMTNAFLSKSKEQTQ